MYKRLIQLVRVRLKEKEIHCQLQDPQRSLGKGEIDTIDWARQLIQQKIACLIILDDRLARKFAHRLGLDFIGTVRLLDIAEQKGLIENAELTIKEISSHCYRISLEILKIIRASNNT